MGGSVGRPTVRGGGGVEDSPKVPRHLLVVSGHPGSGKTTVARQLALALAWPLVSRDDLKELLFDHLGIGDREWSKTLGAASYDLMDRTLGLLMETGAGVVAEANFSAAAARSLRTLAQRRDYAVLEVCCSAPAPLLVARFSRRAHEGQRHAGHRDADNLAEQAARVAVPYQPLGVGPVLPLDTTELPAVVFQRAEEWVAAQLGGLPTDLPSGARL